MAIIEPAVNSQIREGSRKKFAPGFQNENNAHNIKLPIDNAFSEVIRYFSFEHRKRINTYNPIKI